VEGKLTAPSVVFGSRRSAILAPQFYKPQGS
jgi:hypothetical protein